MSLFENVLLAIIVVYDLLLQLIFAPVGILYLIFFGAPEM